MSAKPTHLTTHPPSKPVWWICRIYGGRTIHVNARLWIDAREEAARQAGCSPENVDCERDKDSTAKLIEFWSRPLKATPRLTAWQSSRAAR